MPLFLEKILSNLADSLLYISYAAKDFEYISIFTVVILVFLAYKGAKAIFFIPFLAFFFAHYNFGEFFWDCFVLISAIFTLPILRRFLVTYPLTIFIKNLGLMPKMSETEKIALTSGNSWVDGELFSGKPNFDYISKQKFTKLTSEEQGFLDNEVEELCKMCPDYEVQVKKDLSEKVWKYLKDKKFFGMIIPKKYGGLGFSALAHSAVIEKLASRNVPLAITVMVPNSLGPSELLLHYGTSDQQDYYLPRLADGREIPCFALTETKAGSDATSIISNGIVFKDEDGQVKIRLNWKKRYITLGAVATVIGVAFQLKDPDNLISEQEDVGITCALIPSDTIGVRQGRRHDPLATPFINSPLNGENVVIGLDSIIGGESNAGKGWKMLMESLAAGRGISLPSTSSGGSKLVARVALTYSSIRQQFGLPIAKFEGVEEVLARIISRTYSSDALRIFTASSVDLGMKPSVITAIAKYHSTESFRKIIADGMDILGGRAIIRGPRNLLANAYFSAPISITVEGANIVTRSLIHFGQGAMMCHPYVFKEIEALENKDLTKFDMAFFSHISHLIRNIARSILLSVTRGQIAKTNSKNKLVKKYQKKIAWLSATFAVLADISIAKYGGNLKRKEKLNGRFGDALSANYMICAILRKFEENGFNKDEEEVAEYAIKEHLVNAQNAINGIFENMFSGFSKIIMSPFAFFSRVNIFCQNPSDDLQHKIVKKATRQGYLRNHISAGIYLSQDPQDNIGRIENAYNLYYESLELVEKIKVAISSKKLPKKRIEDLYDEAFEINIINLKEKNQLQDMSNAILDAMEVDEYSLEDYDKIV